MNSRSPSIPSPKKTNRNQSVVILLTIIVAIVTYTADANIMIDAVTIAIADTVVRRKNPKLGNGQTILGKGVPFTGPNGIGTRDRFVFVFEIFDYPVGEI